MERKMILETEKPGQKKNAASFKFLFSAFCLLIFLILSSTTPCKAGVPGAGSPEALIEDGHWKRARAILDPRLAANSRDAQAAYLLSRVMLALNDLDRALKYAQQGVGLEDGNSNYHFQLAEVYGEMADRASMFAAAGLAKKFKAELDASLARDPKNLDALDALMQYSYQAPGMMGGDKKRAQTIADELVQLNPARGYLSQAELAREEKNFVNVEEYFLKAVQADPRNYEAQTSLADFYTQPLHRKIEQAEIHAREAIRLDPSRAKGYSILAKVLALKQRWREVEAVLAASERNVPDDLTPYFEAVPPARQSRPLAPCGCWSSRARRPRVPSRARRTAGWRHSRPVPDCPNRRRRSKFLRAGSSFVL